MFTLKYWGSEVKIYLFCFDLEELSDKASSVIIHILIIVIIVVIIVVIVVVIVVIVVVIVIVIIVVIFAVNVAAVIPLKKMRK